MSHNQDSDTPSVGVVSLSLIGCANELVLYVIVIDINCGLSAFSLGLIPSLRFVDVWGEVLGLLNKPLNCTSLSLCLFLWELGYATIWCLCPGSNGGIQSEEICSP